MGPQLPSRAPRASIAEVVADAELDLSLGDERLHYACCEQDRFFCARPFHPELVATEHDDEDECCQSCVDISYQMMCPPRRPNYQHCPFTGRICL